MNFVACLDSKLRPNFRKLKLGKSPQFPVGIRKYLKTFGITLEPKMLESLTNALKTRILA